MVRDSIGLKEDNSKKSICHHKNFNKRDNQPENLEMMTWDCHKKIHGQLSSKNMKELWKNKEYLKWRNSDEYRKQQSIIIKESWKKPGIREAHMNGVEKRLVNEGRRYPLQFEKWNNSNDNLEHLKKMSKDKKINKIRQEKTLSFWKSERGEECRKKLIERNHKRWHEDRNIIKENCIFCCPDNHSVVSVETTDKFEFVYDITVEKYHNFAVSAGIFVHNCHSGSMTKDVVRNIAMPKEMVEKMNGKNLKKRKFGMKKDTAKSEQRHILLSGCKDNQTSSEALISGVRQGAMTYNFLKESTKPARSWREIHNSMVANLKSGGWSQDPVLSGADDLQDRIVLGNERGSTCTAKDKEDMYF